MKMVVIADDFTGANDTGVQLAKKGARTDVVLSELPRSTQRTDVLVINTESRALTAAIAKTKVAEALQPYCQSDAPPLVYKKIDSTFRGNVGAEIEAAMIASGAQLAIVAAAIPAAGRVTRNGQCWVNGVPLAETEFASDPKTPIVSSHIKTLLGLQSDYPVYELDLLMVRAGKLGAELHKISQTGPAMVVVDAETDADLALLAQATLQLSARYLLVGAAGLANALPASCYLAERQRLPVLVVAGSMSEATQQQIRFAAEEQLLGVVDVDVEALLQPDHQNALEAIIHQAAAVLRDRQHCVLRTCRDANARQMIDLLCERYHLSRQQLGDRISEALGAVTLAIINQSQIGGLFLTGGDIAMAVARALGAEGYRITHEVAPCVPCGTFVNSEIDDLPVITKAGGFGGAATLRDALYFVEEMYSGK
ncbi:MULTISPECIES: four-carbon acid sugar kinase family protein [unclassified Serratia (in: enterobacteria)]|uniref:D-threonate kinase n=1 Tax=unclassified Serratia (in: enterobacteria) TaxID=2647522 RepID=UPI000503EB4F|nr:MULTISPECIES: four-carbon acid sugar kinase family protein [unclassified Serratia (in: enterobacteria)]KFK92668.1 membrane protein [Serratia sp. Ag2]KFL00674.1 membrane protein [Serratia sp. Ag1]